MGGILTVQDIRWCEMGVSGVILVKAEYEGSGWEVFFFKQKTAYEI